MTSGPDGFGKAETLENEPPRRRFPRSVLLAATTAVVLATGAGVAAASALSPAPSPTGTPPPAASPSAVPSGSPSDKGRGWGRGFGGPPVHGEFVVPDGQGAYVTVATQYGEVTAVGQDSVTVKSEDGYTKQYAVNADTRVNRDQGIDAIKAGQKVMVSAKVTGGTATAVTVHDVTARDGRGRHPHGDDHWGDRNNDGNGDRNGGMGGPRHGDHQPTPSPSATS
ncbi:hypothetical protein ACIBQ6_05950 [Nonomuraea sp. NPDC049655]|uniref:hypothetical protein n=1 Tax=Nonomuraea sp. NPDC049655 TaxID=3364355 RepID=UPI0037ADB9C0